MGVESFESQKDNSAKAKNVLKPLPDPDKLQEQRDKAYRKAMKLLNALEHSDIREEIKVLIDNFIEHDLRKEKLQHQVFIDKFRPLDPKTPDTAHHTMVEYAEVLEEAYFDSFKDIYKEIQSKDFVPHNSTQKIFDRIFQVSLRRAPTEQKKQGILELRKKFDLLVKTVQ